MATSLVGAARSHGRRVPPPGADHTWITPRTRKKLIRGVQTIFFSKVTSTDQSKKKQSVSVHQLKILAFLESEYWLTLHFIYLKLNIIDYINLITVTHETQYHPQIKDLSSSSSSLLSLSLSSAVDRHSQNKDRHPSTE